MLERLAYSVTFPTTGRTLKNTLNFQKGFGAIVGPNEAGKSLVIEMIRFCLFGSAALRGKAEDYKSLKASCTFRVQGKPYLVERTATRATLTSGKDTLATGTKPVNAKVCEILGFGLDVFDVACVANQGDLEKLGTMKPTERKRMVDSVIGVTKIDALEKLCADEALGLEREAAALERTVVAPIPPVQPDGYKPSAHWQDELVKLAKEQREADQIKGWLQHEKTEPVKPVDPSPHSTVEELEEWVERAQELKAVEKRLRELPEPSPYSDDELDQIEQQAGAYNLWLDRVSFLKRHPRPEYEWPEVEGALEYWEWKEQLDKLKAMGEATCPCGKTFALEHEKITGLEADIRGQSQPRLTLQVAEAQRKRWDDYHDSEIWNQWEALEHVVEVAQPKLHPKEVAACRVANAGAAERYEAFKRKTILIAMGANEDWQSKYQDKLAYERAVEEYENALAEYMRWKELYDQKSARLVNELIPLLRFIPVMQDGLKQAQSFEALYDAYQRDLVRYADVSKQISDLRSEAAQWRTGKNAMVELRSLIKAHLVPSLNKVASYFINQMTGGERQVINVDEEFNIEVDGQTLDTLSGSGKAVANLSLRLALGQVLTNNIMSLFMGDEIDASMDANRAEKSSDLLHNLADKISQIILVTHKSPTADYTVRLGEMNDGRPHQG